MFSVRCGRMKFSHHKETGNRNLWVIFYSGGRRCEAVVVSILQIIPSHFSVGSCDKLRITIELKIVRIVLSVT